LLSWNLGHWAIENRSHYIRHVTFGEDARQVRKGNAPDVLAALRNGLVTWLRAERIDNTAAALGKHAYQGAQLLARFGIVKG